MISLLTFTTLYPNARRPSHGIFVENRVRQLMATREARFEVLAPIPYAPALPWLSSRYQVFRNVPIREERYGITLHHPRYFLLPKVSMTAAPASLYWSAKRALSRMVANGYEFDLIDGHYFYPDGVAAILLGRHFDKPVTITARGSDINILSKFRLPRAMIRWAAREAAGIIAVSGALKMALVELGVDADKIEVLRNGVDLERFHPGARALARKQLGFTRPTLLSVGNLIPLKGHDLAIAALARLPGHDLMIVGDGPEQQSLEALAQRLGVADRTRFLGRQPHERLPDLYRAADLLLLLSTNEGLPNVLLEAMACGTPVVATPAGGTPEVVSSPTCGELVHERTAEAVARSIAATLARQPDPRLVRAQAERFGWEATTKGQLSLYRRILANRPVMRAARIHPQSSAGAPS